MKSLIYFIGWWAKDLAKSFRNQFRTVQEMYLMLVLVSALGGFIMAILTSMVTNSLAPLKYWAYYVAFWLVVAFFNGVVRPAWRRYNEEKERTMQLLKDEK